MRCNQFRACHWCKRARRIPRCASCRVSRAVPTSSRRGAPQCGTAAGRSDGTLIRRPAAGVPGTVCQLQPVDVLSEPPAQGGTPRRPPLLREVSRFPRKFLRSPTVEDAARWLLSVAHVRGRWAHGRLERAGLDPTPCPKHGLGGHLPHGQEQPSPALVHPRGNFGTSRNLAPRTIARRPSDSEAPGVTARRESEAGRPADLVSTVGALRIHAVEKVDAGRRGGRRRAGRAGGRDAPRRAVLTHERACDCRPAAVWEAPPSTARCDLQTTNGCPHDSREGAGRTLEYLLANLDEAARAAGHRRGARRRVTRTTSDRASPRRLITRWMMCTRDSPQAWARRARQTAQM
jgi:hypothetical protein